MSPDWVLKPLTTAHPLTATLSDTGGPIDLPVGTTVTIRAKAPGATTTLLSASATVVEPGAAPTSPNRGVVSYTLQSADLKPGIYEVDFLVTIPGLGVQPVPEDGYMNLLVLEGAQEV